MTAKDTFKTIDELAQALEGVGYFAERRLAWAKQNWPKPWPKF
jgi:hypothetical protein